MNKNEFDAVGRLIATYKARGNKYGYVMYVGDDRIEFIAPFELPSDISEMDYIHVKGYINGRVRTQPDGSFKHSQSYMATFIEKAESELEKAFDVKGQTANCYFNTYIAGTISEFLHKGENFVRFSVRVPANPEMRTRDPRFVVVTLSLTRFKDFDGEIGDNICIYAKNVSRTIENENTKTTLQRLRAEDYSIIKEA